MNVTLTHINGKPIRERRRVRVINAIGELSECLTDCFRLSSEDRWFSPERVERLRFLVSDSLHRSGPRCSDAGLTEWLNVVNAKVQEIDATITLLELSGQL